MQPLKNHPAIRFAREMLGIDLHHGQQEWLISSLSHGKNILVPSNQWGKTFITAVKHLFLAYTKPQEFIRTGGVRRYNVFRKFPDGFPYATLNLSPRLRQVAICYRYMWDLCKGNFYWEKVKQGTYGHKMNMMVNDSKLKNFIIEPERLPRDMAISTTPMRFKNGSAFYAAPTGGDQAAGIQGAQFNYISYDECPLSGHLKEELGGRIMSRMIKYGINIDLIGTPDDNSESFADYQTMCEEAVEGRSDWKIRIGHFDENEFIKKEIRTRVKADILKVDARRYAQVIEGQFVTSSRLLFDVPTVTSLFSGRWNLPYKAIPDHQYIIGVDWAMGQEHTCMICIDYTEDPWKIVDFFRCQGKERSPQMQYTELLEMKQRYNDAEVIMDTNGLGGSIIEQDLADIGAHGFKFTPGQKAGLILALKKALCDTHKGETGKLKSPLIQQLKKELFRYQEKDDRNREKDTVIALALCCYFLEGEGIEEFAAVDYDFLSMN